MMKHKNNPYPINLSMRASSLIEIKMLEKARAIVALMVRLDNDWNVQFIA